MSARCGCSFCKTCVLAYLSNHADCPKCGAGPFDANSLFPNVLLNKFLSRTAGRSTPTAIVASSTSSAIERIQRSILHDAKLTASELESLVNVLLEKKKRMEANEQDVQMDVLYEFLQAAQQRRKQLLERVRAEISVLDTDIESVQSLRSKVRSARRRTAWSASPALPTPPPLAPQSSSDSSSASVSDQGSPALLPVGGKRSHDASSSSSGVPRSPGSDSDSASDSPPPAAACEAAVSRKRRVMEHLDVLEGAYFSMRCPSLPALPPFVLVPPSAAASSAPAGSPLLPAYRPPAHGSPASSPFAGPADAPHSALMPPAALSPALFARSSPACPSSVDSPRAPSSSSPAHGRLSPDSEGRAACAAGWEGAEPSLRSFASDLASFTKYHRLELVRTIESADLFHSSNIVSSVEFDRDHELFATAGVTKKIRVYDLAAACRPDEGGPAGRVFPVQEIATRTKLSCLSWNAYVKRHLLSSDYDGVVALWDVQTGQQLGVFDEHEKRVWSVDFCRPDPLRWASGSDDGKVKVWSCNEYSSCTTIEVPNRANVCSVRFNPVTAYSIAVGAADHKVYSFDLRHLRQPVLTLGHRKAVSYVRFLNRSELVSASTDSTLKVWGIDRGECLRSLTGHSNEKNFVGLSAERDLIASGSEDNAVYLWHRSLPRPILSYSFSSRPPPRPAVAAPSHSHSHAYGSTSSGFSVGPAAALFSAPPVPGGAGGGHGHGAGAHGHMAAAAAALLQPAGEVEDESGRFISSVCLRSDGETVLAANSVGTLKILRLVSR
eukprot:tig00020964_g16814.t1